MKAARDPHTRCCASSVTSARANLRSCQQQQQRRKQSASVVRQLESDLLLLCELEITRCVSPASAERLGACCDGDCGFQPLPSAAPRSSSAAANHIGASLTNHVTQTCFHLFFTQSSVLSDETLRQLCEIPSLEMHHGIVTSCERDRRSGGRVPSGPSSAALPQQVSALSEGDRRPATLKIFSL